MIKRIDLCAEIGGNAAVFRLDEVLQRAPRSVSDVALFEVASWLGQYVSRPHADLGRSGDVCPWTRRSAELQSLWLDLCASDHSLEVDAQMIAAMRVFLRQREDVAGAFRAIVTVFPRRDAATEQFVVATHARLKPKFLANCLMFGEFYPSCEKPGLRNPSFRPLRSPWPLLVIRPMVETDIEFLTDRDEFVVAYLEAQRARGRERFAQWLREHESTLAPERCERLRRLLKGA